MMIEWGNTSKT